MDIVFASNNLEKIKELKYLLKNHNILSIQDICPGSYPEENGNSFEENAIIKAESLRKYTTLPIIADDSGLCIEILNNDPGIHSAQWMIDQYGKNNNIIGINKIYKKLLNTNPAKWNAFFVCTIAFSVINKPCQIFTGTLNGKIILPPKGNYGFGYDSIFQSNEHEETLAEMDFQKKQKISHRNQAISKLLEYLDLD